MKRSLSLALVPLAVLGLGGSVGSTAQARCAVVIEASTGAYNDAACTVAGGTREYIKVNPGGVKLGGITECAEVENPATEPGRYTEEHCASTAGEKRWIKVVKKKGAAWTIAGTQLSSGQEESVASDLGEGTTATLKGKLLGQEFVLTASKLSSSGGRIFQEESAARDEEVLELSGLTVDKPAGCAVVSPVKIPTLSTELVEVGETLYDKFAPKSGETLATVKVEKCAIAGSYSLKGTEYALTEPLGVELSSQPLAFSPAILAAAGGVLTLGSSAAELTAEAVYHLSGANSGKAFGAE